MVFICSFCRLIDGRNPRRDGPGKCKFQFHELAAVRANDPTFSPSAADIDTLFASPGKALFDAALYDVPAIPREIARDCLVALYEETGFHTMASHYGL